MDRGFGLHHISNFHHESLFEWNCVEYSMWKDSLNIQSSIYSVLPTWLALLIFPILWKRVPYFYLLLRNNALDFYHWPKNFLHPIEISYIGNCLPSYLNVILIEHFIFFHSTPNHHSLDKTPLEVSAILKMPQFHSLTLPLSTWSILDVLSSILWQSTNQWISILFH